MAGARISGSSAMLALAVAWGCCPGLAAGVAEDQTATASFETPALLTLEDALALALTHSPELADFSWEVRAAEAREIQADKIPNPELDLRLWRLGERAGIQHVGRRRIILSQEFELGGERSRRVNLAQIDSQLAGLDYRTQRAEVEAVVTIRFAEVLGAQRRVESLGRFVDFVETLQEAARTMVETGALRALEVHQITGRLGRARIERHRAEAELATARFALAATWGGTSPAFEAVVGELEKVRPVPDIDTVLEMARRPPGPDRWDTELARSQAALSLAKARRVPDFTFGAGVRWAEGGSKPDYLLDMEIDLPLYDRKQGDILEAQTEISRVKSRREAATAADAQRIAELFYGLQESAARSTTLGNEIVPAARASFEGFRRGFEGQEADLDDLLDSRRDLAEAEVQYTEALVDYHQALASLEALVMSSL